MSYTNPQYIMTDSPRKREPSVWYFNKSYTREIRHSLSTLTISTSFSDCLTLTIMSNKMAISNEATYPTTLAGP
jgi:hypothetical protein